MFNCKIGARKSLKLNGVSLNQLAFFICLKRYDI